MRAVALADKAVQEKVTKGFVPLKIAIAPKTKAFPLAWPAMRPWALTYWLMGGEKVEGITGCAVVSPDLEVEYGNTGSAFVWEMFDSTAYDAGKFAAMLDRAAGRAAREREIRAAEGLTPAERDRQIAAFHAEVQRAVGQEGRFRLPPRGFTIDGAVRLFEMSGDLPKKR